MKQTGFRRKTWQEMLAEKQNKIPKSVFQKGYSGEISEVVYYKDMRTGKTSGMKRSRLKKESDSPTAVIKRDIQARLRDGAILRDGGCVLRHFPEAGECFDRRKDGELILQAEHLITRANSATYADLRNIVCLCRGHHLKFKKQHSYLYWKLIERQIGPDRWKWFKLAEADKRKINKPDWKLSLLAIEQDIKNLKKI